MAANFVAFDAGKQADNEECHVGIWHKPYNCFKNHNILRFVFPSILALLDLFHFILPYLLSGENLFRSILFACCYLFHFLITSCTSHPLFLSLSLSELPAFDGETRDITVLTYDTEVTLTVRADAGSRHRGGRGRGRR